MRRESKPEQSLESVLVDPTSRNLRQNWPFAGVLNSWQTGKVQKLSKDCGVDNSQETSARSLKGRSDVVRRAAHKVVLSGYVDRDHREAEAYISAHF
jgi:hypothetical protein